MSRGDGFNTAVGFAIEPVPEPSSALLLVAGSVFVPGRF